MHWTWLINQPNRNGQPRYEDWILFAASVKFVPVEPPCMCKLLLGPLLVPS